MAIAKITVTCRVCGKQFDHRKACRNRREANEYESWAENHVDTCPECRSKRIADEKLALLNAVLGKYDLTLPELEGVSEKQISYAVSVRNRYLSGDIASVKQYGEGMMQFADNAYMQEFEKECTKHGMTSEEGIAYTIKEAGLYTIHFLLTCKSAREILDRMLR